MTQRSSKVVRHTYARNDPMNRVDARGEESVEITTWSVCNMTGGSDCGDMPHAEQAKHNSLWNGLKAGSMVVGGLETALAIRVTVSWLRSTATQVAAKQYGKMLLQGVKDAAANARKEFRGLVVAAMSLSGRELREEAVEQGVEGASKAAQLAKPGSVQRVLREEQDAAKKSLEKAREVGKQCIEDNCQPPPP